MDGQNSTKFCIYITIDMIYPLSVFQTELCSWTYLCPLIVLCRGYGQILWQFEFLQVTRTTIKSRMSSKFDQIRPWSVELAALERLKKSFTYTYLRTIQNIFMTCWLAGERSLPFGLLVKWMASWESWLFAYAKTKDADHLCSNCAAYQCLCFSYMDSTIPLLSKSEISSL